MQYTKRGPREWGLMPDVTQKSNLQLIIDLQRLVVLWMSPFLSHFHLNQQKMDPHLPIVFWPEPVVVVAPVPRCLHSRALYLYLNELRRPIIGGYMGLCIRHIVLQLLPLFFFTTYTVLKTLHVLFLMCFASATHNMSIVEAQRRIYQVQSLQPQQPNLVLNSKSRKRDVSPI